MNDLITEMVDVVEDTVQEAESEHPDAFPRKFSDVFYNRTSERSWRSRFATTLNKYGLVCDLCAEWENNPTMPNPRHHRTCRRPSEDQIRWFSKQVTR